MNETISSAAPQMGAEDAGRIADPAKAEEMAYAGKFHREQAVGLANAIETSINNDGTVVTDPFFLDRTGKEKETYTIPEAVKLADEHNKEADFKETYAAEDYNVRKADADAAAAQIEAIKAGKRIVQEQE